MSGISRVFILIGLILVTSNVVFGQAARTPFSSFGIGEYYGNGLAHNQGMGVGISNPQYRYLNNQNPALLIFNRLTTFEAGYVGEVRNLKNSTTKEKNGSGNLNYLLIGFPIKPGTWTTSFGIMPYTTVNYKLSYTQGIENTASTVDVAEVGSGGINQASWSHGVSITRNISVGVRANYLFSSIERSFDNRLSQSDAVLVIPSIHTRQNFSDFSFTGALSMRKDSLTRKNHRVNFGLVYDFKANIKTRYYEAVLQKTALVTVTDTLVSNRIGQTTLPQTLSAGISFERPDYWSLGLDATWLDYSQFRDMNGNKNGATTGWKVAFGGEFVPDPMSLSSYLKRLTYRAGASMETYPYLVNGNALRDLGINFGFSMPVARYSSLDLGFKVGKRGQINTNTVVENYFKIYFGVTFNDQWFIKRRFD